MTSTKSRTRRATTKSKPATKPSRAPAKASRAAAEASSSRSKAPKAVAKASPRRAAIEASEPPRGRHEDDSRKRLDLDARRAQLLSLGRRLFAERAYDTISIDDIAEAAAISKGLLYHYFGSKRGFYVAVVEQAAGLLVEATAVPPELPPAERARVGLDGYLDFAEAHSNAFLTLLRGGIGNDADVQRIVDATREKILARMLSNMGLAEPRPVFRLAMRGFVGLAEVATIDWLEHRAVSRDVLLRFLLESVYAAVATAIRLDPTAGLALDDRGALEARALSSSR